MGERLHPAAIAVYAADALRQGAVPLLVLLGISVFGGGFDAQAALRGLGFAVAGTAAATVAGWFRWSTTRYSLADQTIRLREGLLSVKEVEVPFARVQAVDVLQGPTQRLFGVHRVDVQTGGGGEGGEIVLSAVDEAEVERIRALLGAPGGGRGRARGARAAAVGAGAHASRRRPPGSSACSCRSPRRVAQMSQQLFDDPIEGERTIVGALPDGTLGWVLVAAGIIVFAWLLGALGTVVAFGGFAVRREGDALRIRRGLIQRRQVTVRVARVRAVRVVESVPRQALGLAALRIEVIGHAKEQAAAQTLFPLLRLDAVEPFLRELLPELADRLDGLAAPPAARPAPLRAAAARIDRDPRRRRRRSRSGARGRCCSPRSAPSTARSASAPPAGGSRAAGSRSARAASRARPCSPPPPAASSTSSTRPRSSAARGSPTSPSCSARARRPGSAISTPTTPEGSGRRSGQDGEQFPMCGGRRPRTFAA